MPESHDLKLDKIKLSINDIILDPNNPRFSKHPDDLTLEENLCDEDVQEETFRKMIDTKSFDVFEIEESIKTKGYIPVDNIFVRKVNEKYVTVEGNRRLSAIKNLLLKNEKGGQLVLPKEILDSFETLEVFDLTENDQSDIDFILGLRHVGSIKQWGLLPSSYNIFKTYMREYCNENGGDPHDPILFNYDPSIAKIVKKLYSVTLAEIRDKIKSYRAYFQVSEELISRGYEGGFPEEKYSILFDTIKNLSLRTFFQFHDNSSVFDEEGLELFINLIFGDNESSPVIKSAAAGDSNLRDFAYVIKEGNQNFIDDIVENRYKPSEVKALIVAERTKKSLLKSLETAFNEMSKIEIGEISEIGHSEDEMLTKIIEIVGRIKRASNRDG
jgi:hypothetical protein|tara:strand:+ start:4219 stop:5373 length:1155 start_codon:yes stop_codon:yes gene_type:complete